MGVSRFFNCINGTKSRKAPHMQIVTCIIFLTHIAKICLKSTRKIIFNSIAGVFLQNFKNSFFQNISVWLLLIDVVITKSVSGQFSFSDFSYEFFHPEIQLSIIWNPILTIHLSKLGQPYVLSTAQKMKFSIKDFFTKFDQIHLLKKSLMENFIFCAVKFKVFFESRFVKKALNF